MTTTEATTINVSNAAFDALSQTLTSMSNSGMPVRIAKSLSDLSDTFATAKNYKGHSRTVTLTEQTADALRSVIAQSDIPESRTKTVTDKLDAAFPQTGTAVAEPDYAEQIVDHANEPEQAGEQAAPAETGEPEQPIVAPNAPAEQTPPVQNPEQTPPMSPAQTQSGMTVADVKVQLPERTVPNISKTDLVVSVNAPDLAEYEVQRAKGGTVRYRSRSRSGRGFVSIVDVTNMPSSDMGLESYPDGTAALVICEQHNVAAPLPAVRPGKFYLRSPELFCATCAESVGAPKPAAEPHEPAKRGRKPKAEKPAKLPEHVKVVKEEKQDDTPRVIHPSDQKATEDEWNNFSAALAASEKATVMWVEDRHYALVYGDAKSIDVYVDTNGIESRWRSGQTNYNSLEDAKASLG